MYVTHILCIYIYIHTPIALTVPDSFAGASRQEGRGFDPGAGRNILFDVDHHQLRSSENGVNKGRIQKPIVDSHTPFKVAIMYILYTPVSDTPT